jgi:hypothetical protein
VQATAPALAAKEPGGQLEHSAEPATAAEPGAQAVQELLLANGCAVPAGQVVQAAAPPLLKEPAAQARQLLLFVALPPARKVPAAQGAGAAPAAHQKPGGQKVAFEAAPPAHMRPALQGRHAEEALAPTLVEKVPPAHCSHRVEAAADEKLPAAQGMGAAVTLTGQ